MEVHLLSSQILQLCNELADACMETERQLQLYKLKVAAISLKTSKDFEGDIGK